MYRPEIDFPIFDISAFLFRFPFRFAFLFVSLSLSFFVFLQPVSAIPFIQSTTEVERENRIYSRELLKDENVYNNWREISIK
jgi:hypothetical protein